MVERLAAIPNLVAWKDGQGDIRRLQAIIESGGRSTAMDRRSRRRHGRCLLQHRHTGVHVEHRNCGAATVFALLHELAANNRAEELRDVMQRCVIPLYSIRSRRKGYEVSTMKVLMDLAGLRGGPVRPPLVTVNAAEREELRAVLESWQPFLID